MIDFRDIELVIFDCDGVLVDSEPLANQVLAARATALGWSMTGEISQRLFKGMTMAQVHERIEHQVNRSLSPDWIEQYHAECNAVFKRQLKPVPGVEALILRARNAGKKICVASQGSHEKMQVTLGTTELLHYFEGCVFSAQDVSRPKPYPDLFLHAAMQMNVAAANSCVIEDSQAGLQAAHAAGMSSIYYVGDISLCDDIGQSDRTIAVHMDEILAA